MNGFTLKVIAEGKVAEHFKERGVTIGLSYVFDVAGANALLRGAHTVRGRFRFSCKEFFHRRHARTDKKQGFVSLGY